MFFRQLILLTLSVLFINADDVDEEKFVHMVLDGINAIDDYQFRTNNSDIFAVKDDSIHNYGEFDFIIVGGGTAGAILANRLSEIDSWNILLLEAGGHETDFSDIPGMGNFLFFSDMNWGYLSTPQKYFGYGMVDQRISIPRGKVIGGSSVINAKMFVRGNKQNFDVWEDLGNKGWSYKNVLPFFKKLEKFTLTGDAGYHSTSGPFSVGSPTPTIYTDIYIDAMKELGFEKIDYNGKNQIGVSQSAFALNGSKISTTGRCYIDPVINKRKNLEVSFNSFVTHLLIENKEAKGVQFRKDGKIYEAFAKKEVILSAGSINTPQILMLSGIGPKEELDKIGVETIADLPVGKYMEDHPVYFGINFRTNMTLFDEPVENAIKDYLKNLRPLTAPYNIETLGFFTVDDNKTNTLPDIQHLVVVPSGFWADKKRFLNLDDKTAEGFKNYNRYTDFLVWIILLNPKSRGTVTLKSNDPTDFPEINTNFFSDADDDDIETMYKGVLQTLKLTETAPFQKVNATFTNLLVGCDEFDTGSREYWYCAIRHLTQTLYHPTGTTRMGTDETDSVVSSTLNVHGIKNLRCADAGIMPKITSGNTMAPVLMIGEKAADIVKSDYGLN